MKPLLLPVQLPNPASACKDDLFSIARRLDAIYAVVSAPPKLALGMEELCAACSISEVTARRWMKEGRLVGTRTGPNGHWLFKMTAIEKALAPQSDPI